MRGKTLTELALDAGLQEAACRVALVRPHADGEAAIAKFLDIPAPTLWPGRYRADGSSRIPRFRKRTPPIEDFSSQKSEAA